MDRIVLHAFNPLCPNPGGCRTWWRRWHGPDENRDTVPLLRMAGRFSRRVRAFAVAHQIPVVACGRGERKHQVAAASVAAHPQTCGLVQIQVSRAVAPVWAVERATTSGALRHLVVKKACVTHDSFQVGDSDGGQLRIKLAGHAPFGAQILLKGQEYVATQARRAAIPFGAAGNCFTTLPAPDVLATVAETVREAALLGRLSPVCERWIYSCCLCFGLHPADQERTGFRDQYAVYQLEYARNVLLQAGHQLEQVFAGLIDRTRRRRGVSELRPLFGLKHRPHRGRSEGSTPVAVLVETPVYALPVFTRQFGQLPLKASTNGERVRRCAAVGHTVGTLQGGRVRARFPLRVGRLQGLVDRWLALLWWRDQAVVADSPLEQLPAPAQVGRTRVGGRDLHQPRRRAVLAAALACALLPAGFRVGDFAAQVRLRASDPPRSYGPRPAAYDLKKLRARGLVAAVPHSPRSQRCPDGARTSAARVVRREQVIKPILAGTAKTPQRRLPQHGTSIDAHYQTLRTAMQALFADLGLAA